MRRYEHIPKTVSIFLFHYYFSFCLFFFPLHISDDCGWCKRPVSLGSTEFLASPEGLIYCTESCFTQSRRASFKRAKTCDWCKHIRHAISYVDFQDGATQLQFCSDKCLNQYKMQIFCKETQAHLDMNPHLKEKGSSSTNALITPDLWLKDCRSRSASPSNSDHSRSSTSPPESVKLLCTTSANARTNHLQQRPFITVAPASKLISRQDRIPIRIPLNDQQSPQRCHTVLHSARLLRKRRSQRLHASARRNADSVKKVNEKCAPDLTVRRPKPIQSSNLEMTRQSAARNLFHTLKTVPTKANLMQRHQILPPPPDLYPLNSHHRPQCQPFGLPHFGAPIQQTTSSTENRLPNIEAVAAAPFQQSPTFNVFQRTSPPPMTLLVPCPIIVPFPVPIPIPLPFESFLKAAKIKLETDKTKAHQIHSKNSGLVLSDTNEIPSIDLLSETDDLRGDTSIEQPLDCTKETAKRVSGDRSDEATNTHVAEEDHDTNNLHDIIVENKFSAKFDSRQCAKRSFSKDFESSRPLRKRNRIIDSDYLLKSNI